MPTLTRADPGIAPLPDGSFESAHPAALTLSIDAGKMRVRGVITTAAPDRAGNVILPNGLRNLDEFMLNPVVLWAHNRTQFPPVGTAEWVDVQPHRVVAETRFARGVPFAEDVFRLYERGVLRGWSIGFVPRRAFRRGTAPQAGSRRPFARFPTLPRPGFRQRPGSTGVTPSRRPGRGVR
ncbi:hypothetical protein J0H58_33885 [bacterium]|nr:hypothetical protein [bacterium]